MSILNKKLDRQAQELLDLFLKGALAPLTGYLNRKDHISVRTNNRLANGYLWPLPLALELSAAEKLQAQLTGRIALLDEEQRVLAEVQVEELYRLPKTLTDDTDKPQTWYASGTIAPVNKVLRPTFNRIRHQASALRDTFHDNGWKRVIAVSTQAVLNQQEMQHACQWLKSSDYQEGGLLLQVTANDSDPALHEQMRAVRHQIRCNAAKQVKLSLLPEITGLSPERKLLLQTLIARNFGATGFLVSASAPRSAQRWLLQHRDELGLEIIAAKRSQSAQQQEKVSIQQMAA